jgi:hypothetical protein
LTTNKLTQTEGSIVIDNWMEVHKSRERDFVADAERAHNASLIKHAITKCSNWLANLRQRNAVRIAQKRMGR